MHGDLEQPERVRALVRFSNQSATVLVATDAAARGLDIDAVDMVFNYELPDKPKYMCIALDGPAEELRQGRP